MFRRSSACFGGFGGAHGDGWNDCRSRGFCRGDSKSVSGGGVAPPARINICFSRTEQTQNFYRSNEIVSFQATVSACIKKCKRRVQVFAASRCYWLSITCARKAQFRRSMLMGHCCWHRRKRQEGFDFWISNTSPASGPSPNPRTRAILLAVRLVAVPVAAAAVVLPVLRQWRRVFGHHRRRRRRRG